MKIIAHRGFWKYQEEKNSFAAIKRAFEEGYGVETDIRDYQGKLVISHNVAESDSILAEVVFKEYQEQGCNEMLALNVKADGLQQLLKPLLEKYEVVNYFLFDMSVPELVVNEREKLRYYTRHSDIEELCVMYNQAQGVWIDSFYDDEWFDIEIVRSHIESGKEVCIVSPELHGKGYEEMWRAIKQSGLVEEDGLFLCTDYPNRAKEYFYGKN